ncbi:MAG: peptide chain release factor N(5)-glutamine methyltransferase [Variibacter sp.]|nr:peptide chain release factor N(5)-glutamine methyltransferase [Variibacter sp.]
MSAENIRAGLTVAQARRLLARQLAAGGIDEAEVDARALVGHALALDLTGLAREAERALTADEARRLNALAARRRAREPVAYIVGEKEFWGLRLRVTPATLIPRPDTETVVEAALGVLGPETQLRIADLGTGSGAILLALLSERPDAEGVGVDVSAAALAVARGNAERLGLARRAHFMRGAFGAALAGGFDLVVSNPPYVCVGELAALAPEVREHEPRLALAAGTDGLDAYRAIAADAARVLRRGGHLVLEIGHGQAESVTRLCVAGGLAPARAPMPDLAGIARALAFRRP